MKTSYRGGRGLGLLIAASTVMVGTACAGPVPGQPIVLPAPTTAGPTPELVPAQGAPGETVPAQGAPDRSTGMPAPAATARPDPPTGGRPCPPSGVLVGTTETDGAMGLRAMSITLFNCGDKPYQMNGYPFLRVLDAERKPIAVTIENGSRTNEDPGPRPLNLQPGGTAYASVRWRNTVTYGDVARGEYLEVAPIGDEEPQVVPKRLDLGTTGRLEVHAWSIT